MSIHKVATTDPLGKKSICIQSMHSNPVKSGTALLRDVMVESLSSPGFEGRVYLHAMWGSHLFHLKRGFCPVEGAFVNLEEMYGLGECMAVENFVKRLHFFEPDVIKVVAVEFNLDPKQITTEDLEKYRVRLTQMSKIQALSATDSFAYRLANSIQSYRDGSREVSEKGLFQYLRNGSNFLRGETMMMTPEGRERWKVAIETGSEFKSFRDLSHLFKRIHRPYVKSLLKKALAGLPGFVPLSTEIRIKYQVLAPHTLTIRGQGPGLDWAHGTPLQKIDGEIYLFQLQGAVEKVAFKVLLDDEQWEAGPNHEIEPDAAQEFVPALPQILINLETSRPLFIRGTGPGMSWDRGIELKRNGGKFVFDPLHADFEFKVLLDDQHWSQGDNYKAVKGKMLNIIPKF